MLWLILLALLSPPGLGAQARSARKPAAPKPEVANRWPIESLSVQGNHNYTPEQILAVAGLKPGQMAGKPDFEAARDRLVATGAFETVGYRFAPSPEGSGYAASFQVTEVTPVYPVRFEDLGVPDKDLVAFLHARDPLYGEKIPATRQVLERYSRLIQDFLASRQKPAKVAGRVTPARPEQFTIVFRPPNQPPSVAQVNFTGNQLISTTTLQNAISDVAVGTPYTEDHFRQLLDNAVRPLYERQGRLRVSFPKIITQQASDVHGLNVLVTVDEGALYMLGNVRLDGLLPVKPDELMKIGAFKTGQPANMEEVGSGVDRIRRRLRRQGYMRAEIRPERHVNDEKKIVDVTLHVAEGPQFLMGKLTIEGLDIYTEPPIRKAWGLPEGKPFDADYPDAFLARLREEQVFENLKKTRSKSDVNEQTHTVNVTLYFE